MTGATASDRAYDAIKQAIIEQRFAPAQRLSERSLSQMLGISRTPVRQALSRLHQDGLLVRGSQNSFEISRMSVADLDEVFEVREWLEGLAARKVAERAVHDEIVQITIADLLQRVQALSAQVPHAEFAQEFSLDIDLHQTLLALAGNRRVQGIVEQMNVQVHRVRILSKNVDRSRQTFREHKAILTSISAGERDQAEDAMRLHIRRAAESAREILIADRSRDLSPLDG